MQSGFISKEVCSPTNSDPTGSPGAAHRRHAGVSWLIAVSASSTDRQPRSLAAQAELDLLQQHMLHSHPAQLSLPQVDKPPRCTKLLNQASIESTALPHADHMQHSNAHSESF